MDSLINISQPDSDFGRASLLQSFLQRFQLFLSHTDSCICYRYYHTIFLLPDSKIQPSTLFLFGKPVNYRIFHNRLQSKSRNDHLTSIYLNIAVIADSAAKPHLLNIHIILHHLQLLIQGNELL